MTTSDIHRVIDAVWRIESARLIAGLARMVRDVGLAEELAQDAIVAALERWPDSGVPESLSKTARKWDWLLICRGLSALERAGRLGGTLGPYALQAAIAACHAQARAPGETDWERIAALYDALAQLSPSPVVELNRAVALSMAFGPQAGLEIVDSLTGEPSLKAYHLLPSVRGELLEKLCRFDEARAEFERAASLTRNERERELLLKRAQACAKGLKSAVPP
jgi:predicted RNA polymerase sigma factor